MAKKTTKDKTQEVVANCNQFGKVVASCDRFEEHITNCDDFEKNEMVPSQYDIERLILTIRGKQVLIDRDLAAIYGVETKRLNEQVRRNIARFPERYRFQLTRKELMEVVANCDRLKTLKFSTTEPFVFTEFGVSMLPSVLNSQKAIDISIRIIDAFVAMRRFMIQNAAVLMRIAHFKKHNTQYPEIAFIQLPHRNHDRFLIIDDKVYLLGASLKDIGTGLCAVTEMTIAPDVILGMVR